MTVHRIDLLNLHSIYKWIFCLNSVRVHRNKFDIDRIEKNAVELRSYVEITKSLNRRYSLIAIFIYIYSTIATKL